MKKLVVIAIVMLMGIGTVSAYNHVLDYYFLTATTGTWSVVADDRGILTLSDVNPRIHYTTTSFQVYSMAVDTPIIIRMWENTPNIDAQEAVLSADNYHIRLLLSNPVWDDEAYSVQFNAQVVEVVNFADETRTDMPSAFDFPALTIETSLNFHHRLMRVNDAHFATTPDRIVCYTLHDNYMVAGGIAQSYLEIAWNRNDISTGIFLRYHEMRLYRLYMMQCATDPPWR